MRKQWKIHRSWHIAAVMWSSLLLGHFFEPKAPNNNHQFGSTFSIPKTHGFRKKTRTNKDNIASKKLQDHHWSPTVWFAIFVSVGSLEPLNAELIKKITLSPNTLGHCRLKESCRAAFWILKWKKIQIVLPCCCAKFDFHKESKCDFLSFCSETSVVIKWIDQHQVNVHVVLAFEKGRNFDALTFSVSDLPRNVVYERDDFDLKIRKGQMLILGSKPKRCDARCCTDWSTCRDASWWALMSTKYSSQRFSGNSETCLANLPIWLALRNLVIWKNQHSEFAIGLRSRVFWAHFQIIMHWRYTPIQKRLLQHSWGTLMLEGQGRLASLHTVSR